MKDHSREIHQAALNKLCRVCAALISRKEMRSKNKPQLCSKKQRELNNVFGIDVSKDDPTKYSNIVCWKCLSRTYRTTKEMNEGFLEVSRSIAQRANPIWQDYSGVASKSSCRICCFSFNIKMVEETSPGPLECVSDVNMPSEKVSETMTVSDDVLEQEMYEAFDISDIHNTGTELTVDNEIEVVAIPFTHKVLPTCTSPSPEWKQNISEHTLQHIINKPTTDPLTPIEEKLTINLVRRLLCVSGISPCKSNILVQALHYLTDRPKAELTLTEEEK
jgi:hypothetical protein